MMLHRNNGKAYLWFLLVPLIIPLVVVITVLSSGGMVLALDHDIELQDVMDENVPNLTATVNGSGGGYYGDSLRVSFSNDTTQTLRIKIPIGLRLAPKDTSVQTMVTAGGEIITVPPGDSSAVLKAFCGEMDDSAPGTLDVFYPDGFVDSKLMKTLKRINEKEVYDSDGQDAVWSHTDEKDISDNDRVKDIIGGGKVPGGKAAAAGAGAAGVAGGATLLLSRPNGGGAVKAGEKMPDKPDLDANLSPDEFVAPPEDLDLPEEFDVLAPPPSLTSEPSSEDTLPPADKLDSQDKVSAMPPLPPATEVQPIPPAESAEPKVFKPAPDPSQYLELMSKLNDRFLQDVRDMHDEGYWVKNPQAKGPWLLKPADWFIDNVLVSHTGSILEWLKLIEEQGGRCEEFAWWGQKRVEKYAREIFGDGVVVDTVLVQENNTFFEDYFVRNHAATRIITPDGRRYILDYWDNMQRYDAFFGNLRVAPVGIQHETNWANHWRDQIAEENSTFLGSQDPRYRALEKQLHDLHQSHGLDNGADMVQKLESSNIQKNTGLSDLQKEIREARLNTIIKSYRLNKYIHY